MPTNEPRPSKHKRGIILFEQFVKRSLALKQEESPGSLG